MCYWIIVGSIDSELNLFTDKIGSFFQPILIKIQDMFYFNNFSRDKSLQILEARMIACLISGRNSQRVDEKKISNSLAFQIQTINFR